MQQKMGMLNLISIQARQHRYEQDKETKENTKRRRMATVEGNPLTGGTDCFPYLGSKMNRTEARKKTKRSNLNSTCSLSLSE